MRFFGTIPTWYSQAKCLGTNPELFFAERGENVIRAKAVCRSCPVKLLCLEAHLGERFGVWGGMSEEERRVERRRRRNNGKVA